MADDRTKKFEQLRQAHESGLLDADTYQASVAALEQQQSVQTHVQGSGNVAQGEGAVSAGGGSVAVGGDVSGDIYVGGATYKH